MRFAGCRASRPRSEYRNGAELQVGDVIDYTAEGFQIVRWGEYDSPLIPITGPGRIGYDYQGNGMAIYDNHPVRVRVFS